MTAPALRPVRRPRDRYTAADEFRAAAAERHRQAQARREASIDRCPECGAWRMHPQPGDGWRGKVAGRRRPARHTCPSPREDHR